MLPEFAKACRAHDTPVVILRQDAFAADYQEEEYRLIGMATLLCRFLLRPYTRAD
jgi:hypothetical protein